MSNKKKISFDFDCTLNDPAVTKVAIDIIKNHSEYEVVITTSRLDRFKSLYSDANDDIFKLAEELGIKEINFTNLKEKVEFFRGKPEYIVHVDDNLHECRWMNEDSKCYTSAINWINDPEWSTKLFSKLGAN